MANILIISSNLKNWDKNSGGVERTATLAEALVGHDVTFLCFAWDTSSEVKKINNTKFLYSLFCKKEGVLINLEINN
jgi:hypothetical protein